MTILSWNVNGLKAIVKKDFFEVISKIDADIICLQETKMQNDEVYKIFEALKDYHCYANSAEKKGYSGTVLLSKIKPISVNLNSGDSKENEGRVICAEYTNFFVVNVYVPNSGQKLKRLEFRKNWDVAFLTYLIKLRKLKPVIICGDFNVAHESIDLKNDKANYNKTAGYTQIEIDGMTHLLKAGFIDSFRYLYPKKIAYTFWSFRFNARAKNIGWRVDYILIDKVLAPKIKDALIFSEILGSDHCPIGIQLET